MKKQNLRNHGKPGNIRDFRPGKSIETNKVLRQRQYVSSYSMV